MPDTAPGLVKVCAIGVPELAELPVIPPVTVGSGHAKVAPAGVDVRATEVVAPEQIVADAALTVGAGFTVTTIFCTGPVQPAAVAETA